MDELNGRVRSMSKIDELYRTSQINEWDGHVILNESDGRVVTMDELVEQVH